MGWLSRLFGGGGSATLPPEEHGADVVRFLAVTPVARSWARMCSGGLEQVWNACPRADWLADIALRGGVDRGTVSAALSRLADEFEAPAEGDLAAAFGEFLDEVVDSSHEVRAARALEAYQVDANRSITALWEESPDARAMVDDLENGFHRRLADQLRDELPYGLLRAKLYPATGEGPYR